MTPRVAAPTGFRRTLLFCMVRATDVVRHVGVLALLAAACLAGCATPARPKAVQYAPAQPLNGVYQVEFLSRVFGPIRARMTAEALQRSGPSGPVASFKANTRPGVAWNLVGGMAGAFGPLLAPYIFPQGMLLTWTSAMPNPADPAAVTSGQEQVAGEGRLGPATLSRLQAKTFYKGEDRPVEIRIEDSRTVAVMMLKRLGENEKNTPIEKPDYAAMVQDYDTILHRDYMDREVLAGDDDELMISAMSEGAKGAQDDLEFLFGCALAWRVHQKMPLPAIYRAPEYERTNEAFATVQDPQPALRVYRDEPSGAVVIEAIAFLQAKEVDAAFEKALALQPKALILDLRNCPGIESCALASLCWLVKEPVEIGTLVGAAHRAMVLGEAKSLKSAQEAAAAVTGAPVVELSGGADVSSLDSVLDHEGWARVRVSPNGRGYAGTVAVLTSRRTFSTAEMVADVLKVTGRATVIGGRTGKRANLGRDRNLPSVPGWVCRLPMYDYVAARGVTLRKTGVEPDIDTEREKALSRALEWLASAHTGGEPAAK